MTAHGPERRFRSVRSSVAIEAEADLTRAARYAAELHVLALLWQILSGMGFPNQFFNDSWLVGF